MSYEDEFKKAAKEFDKKKSVEPLVGKELYDFEKDNFPDIVTSEEAKQLRAAREVPAPELNLTMRDERMNDIVSADAKQREERINYIDDSLEAHALRFEENFDQAVEDDSPEI